MNWQGWHNEMTENENTVAVRLADFATACGLTIISGDPQGMMRLSTNNINRPGLLLAGFEDYFAAKRVQVLGNAETYYISKLPQPEALEAAEKFFEKKPPCVILTRGITAADYFLNFAAVAGVPVLSTEKITTQLVSELTLYLNNLLAETASVHGTLMEVSGVGVLITGDSGMGKSETALELVHRGHKLVADDAVIVKKVGDSIIGTAPETIRFFMEVRGIGIIDVRQLFGVGSVLYDMSVDLVIKLENWTAETESERFMYEEVYENILGIDVPRHTMPVMAGRNLAIVVEVAARNHRLKKMGVNATDELLKNQNFIKKD